MSMWKRILAVVCIIGVIAVVGFVANAEVEEEKTYETGGEPDGATGLLMPEGWETAANWDASTCENLPDKFDWRDVRHGPPIRNQGGCGSCWSFAIVRAMEWLSHLILPMEANIDLAEQTMVSTCESGGDCGGGYFTALNYARDKGIPNEKDDPYTASNSQCKRNLPVKRKITGWSYVGNQGQTPTPEQVMCAIWKHGPVVVDVNGSFGGYRSGVYNSCGSTNTNHMVIATGWDKTSGKVVYLADNSWGTAWGEQGRFRIVARDSRGRPCNGFAAVAAYAVFQDIPDLQIYLGL